MKKFWSLLAMLVAAVGFTLGAAELASYAPRDTNVIVYVNGRQFVKGHLYSGMLKQYPALKSAMDQTDAEIQKEAGITLPQLLNSEACFFINIEKMENRGEISAIGRAGDPIVKMLFDKASQDPEDAAKLSTVAGKRVIKDGKTTYTEMGPDMLAISEGSDEVLTPGYNKLASRIDTDAIISIALDFTAVNIPVNNENQQLFAMIFGHVKQLSANFRETSGGIRMELVAEYDSEKAAQESNTCLDFFRQLLMSTQEDPAQAEQIRAVFSRINRQQDGSKIVITVDVSDNELLDVINGIIAGNK